MVTYPVEHVLDDPELKDEVITLLLDSPYIERAVELLEKICKATKESACRVCMEIINDLLEAPDKINPPFEKDDMCGSHDAFSGGSVDSALNQSLETVKINSKLEKRYRHPLAWCKNYTYHRLKHFYADPTKIGKGNKVKIV